MKALTMIERLAEIARQEPVPSVDVRGAVLQKIMISEEPVISSWWLGVSVLATSLSFILFWQVCLVSQDPLIEFFETIRSVLL
jgi:hypothetical protein